MPRTLLPSSSSHQQQLHIAIIGAGLAGCLLAIGLREHTHLDVQIYNAGNESLGGAQGYGLAQVYLDALKMVWPGALERGGGMERAGAFFRKKEDREDMIMDAGPYRGTPIHFDYGLRKGLGVSVQRQALLRELRAEIDNERLHFDKRLVSIEDIYQSADRETAEFRGEKGVRLHFSDDTITHADIVIGADGIHSMVRAYILGPDHPRLDPEPAFVFQTFLSGVSPQTAKDIISEEFPDIALDPPRTYTGKGSYLLGLGSGAGKELSYIIAFTTEERFGKAVWTRPTSKEELKEKARRSESRHMMAAVKILTSTTPPDKLMIQSLWQSALAPTYVRTPALVMGDAAHAPLPYQASGAGQSIEDALVLSRLLGECTSRSHINAAFKAFDQVRKPRTQEVMIKTAAVGNVMMTREPWDISLDPATIGNGFEGKWKYIDELDTKSHVEEALRIFREELRDT